MASGQLIPVPDREEIEFPSYYDPGWILVRVSPPTITSNTWDYDVLGYDGGSSVYWITQGMGLDFWLHWYADFPAPGTYMLTGITGEHIRGDGWETDDDEDWAVGDCRLASAAEIEEYWDK